MDENQNINPPQAPASEKRGFPFSNLTIVALVLLIISSILAFFLIDKIKPESTKTANCMTFTSIEEAMNRTREACYLNLSSKNLSELPADISKLKNLKTIDLSDNNFSDLPKELSQIKSLEEINISSNKIVGVPQNLGLFTNIKKINLSDNQIIQMQYGFIKSALPESTEVILE